MSHSNRIVSYRTRDGVWDRGVVRRTVVEMEEALQTLLERDADAIAGHDRWVVAHPLGKIAELVQPIARRR